MLLILIFCFFLTGLKIYDSMLNIDSVFKIKFLSYEIVADQFFRYNFFSIFYKQTAVLPPL